MMLNTLASGLDKMRARLAQLRHAFDARPRRERLLLIGAAVAVAWMLADNLWLAPAYKQWSAVNARRNAAVAAVKQLEVGLQRQSADTRSAEQQLRADVVHLRKRVGEGDAALRAFGATLVSAPEMVPMLGRLLAQVGGLRLRSMQSLGSAEVGAAIPGPVAASAPAAAAAVKPVPANPTLTPNPTPNRAAALYRHGVELTIEGSYADVVAFLLAVEAMPQHILWGGLQLKVEQHPKMVVTLRLYTLSQDRNWLEI